MADIPTAIPSDTICNEVPDCSDGIQQPDRAIPIVCDVNTKSVILKVETDGNASTEKTSILVFRINPVRKFSLHTHLISQYQFINTNKMVTAPCTSGTLLPFCVPALSGVCRLHKPISSTQRKPRCTCPDSASSTA